MACLPSGSEGIDPELVALGEDHTGAPVAGPPRGGNRGVMTNKNNGSASCSTVSTSSCTPSPPSMLPVHLCPPPQQQQQQHRVVPNLRTTMTSPQPTAQQQPPSGALYGVSNGPAHQMASRGDQVVMTSPTKFPPPMPINSKHQELTYSNKTFKQVVTYLFPFRPPLTRRQYDVFRTSFTSAAAATAASSRFS